MRVGALSARRELRLLLHNSRQAAQIFARNRRARFSLSPILYKWATVLAKYTMWLY
jgi:hypothetical protein